MMYDEWAYTAHDQPEEPVQNGREEAPAEEIALPVPDLVRPVTVEPPRADVRKRADTIDTHRQSTSLLDDAHTPGWVEDLQKAEDDRTFSEWFEGVEDEMALAEEEAYHAYRAELFSSLATCQSLIVDATSSLDLLDSISFGLNQINSRTSTFQQQCEALLDSQTRLTDTADAISMNLQPFTSLDFFMRKLNAPGADFVTAPDFAQMLAELDDSLRYMDDKSDFLDSGAYKSRLRHCMTRAMTLIRVYFVNKVKELGSDVQRQLAAPGVSDTTRATLVYTKFRVLGPHLAPLVEHISIRARTHQEYNALLGECFDYYFGLRRQLVNPSVTKRVADINAAHKDLVSFARSAIGYIKTICVDEHDLFRTFTRQNGDDSLKAYLQGICAAILEHLKPRAAKERSLNELCELCTFIQSQYHQGREGEEVNPFDIIKGSNPEYQNASKGPDFKVLFQPALVDIQRQIILRVRTAISKDIQNYTPTDTDLDYPNNLINTSSSASVPLTPSTPMPKTPKIVEWDYARSPVLGDETKDYLDTGSFVQGWYPTMRNAIALLSRTHQILSSRYFDNLAHEIVRACITSLVKAFTLISTKHSPIDGHLFLIKHLLILKDQVSAFDINAYTEPEPAEHVGLAGAVSEIFSTGASLLSPGIFRRITGVGTDDGTSKPDTRTELDERLRKAVNGLTDFCTTALTAPLSSSSPPAVQMSEFRVKAQSEVPTYEDKFNRYLEDERTTAILLGAIQDGISEAYEKYHQNHVRDKKAGSREEDVWDAAQMLDWLDGVMTRQRTSYIEGDEKMRAGSLGDMSLYALGITT
ncbi:Golgi transport complex subunit 3 [Saitoella coloradoensis]